MILWEIVAYLADNARRALTSEALRRRVGLTPEKILAAQKTLLREIASVGGSIAVEERRAFAYGGATHVSAISAGC